MIRISEDDARLLADWIDQSMQAVRGNADGTPPQIEIPVEFEDISRQIQDQFNHPGYAVQLIDEVHRILSRSRGTIIAGETLNLLRSAIFRPSELALFRTASRETVFCDSCRQPVRHHTIVTYDPGENRFFCPSCLPTSAITCSGCSTRLKLPNGAITRIVAKIQKECPICTARARGEQVEVPEAAQERAIRELRLRDDENRPAQPVRDLRDPVVAPRTAGRGVAGVAPIDPTRRLTMNQLARVQQMINEGARIPEDLRQAFNNTVAPAQRILATRAAAIAERPRNIVEEHAARLGGPVEPRRRIQFTPPPPVFGENGQLGGALAGDVGNAIAQWDNAQTQPTTAPQEVGPPMADGDGQAGDGTPF